MNEVSHGKALLNMVCAQVEILLERDKEREEEISRLEMLVDDRFSGRKTSSLASEIEDLELKYSRKIRKLSKKIEYLENQVMDLEIKSEKQKI